MIPASNSNGPLWCAPHIEGRHLRDQITSIVKRGGDWFPAVHELLNVHQLPSEWRTEFYRHAQSVEEQCQTSQVS